MHTLVLFLCVVFGQSSGDDPPWERVSPPESGFEAVMPGNPKITARTIRPLPTRTVTVHLASVSYKDGKALFMVGYHDLLATPEDETKTNTVLDGAVKGSVLNALGKLTKNDPVTLGEFPGRQFEYTGNRFNQKIVAVSRVYVAGQRMYQLTALHAPEVDISAETAKFFDSFKITAPAAAAQKAPQPANPSAADRK